MTAGSSANVVVNGTWASNRKLVVSAADKVTMTNREDGATHDLDVTFSDIALVGSNTAVVSKTESIAIESMSDIMFGVWEGTFTYNADMVDIELITFTLSGGEIYECQAELGMTWREWVNSEYNTVGAYITDDLTIGTQNEGAPIAPQDDLENCEICDSVIVASQVYIFI
jgi:hypothetical protein